MKSNKWFSMMGIILIVLVLAALACNVPQRMISFQADDEPDEIRNLSAEYEATIVSDEGGIVSLPIRHNTTWVCKDIDGEVSALQATQREGFTLKKADLNLYFNYRSDDSIDEGIHIYYYLDAERDEAIIGVENKIVDWNHVKWTSTGELKNVELKDNWAFGGNMEVKVVQKHTSPPSSGESKKQKAFFGLISLEDYHKAYLCDEGATGLPDGLENIIDEQDFQDFCLGWYYECAALVEEDD